MRGATVLCIMGACALSCADRIILAPSATKVRYRQARFEYAWEPSRPLNESSYLSVGVTREIEAEFQIDRREGRPRLGTFNASYQYIVPIIDAAPGIAFGVQDAYDRTSEGRMYYLAATYKFGLDGLYNQNTPLELSGGFGFGRRSGVFVGVMIPFTSQFRLLAEHNLRRVSAGFEVFVRPNASLRWIFREGQTQLSARLTLKY